MSRARNTLWPFRDRTLNTDGTPAWQRPLCRLHGTSGVSQRRPWACELAVGAQGGAGAQSPHLHLIEQEFALYTAARGPGLRHKETPFLAAAQDGPRRQGGGRGREAQQGPGTPQTAGSGHPSMHVFSKASTVHLPFWAQTRVAGWTRSAGPLSCPRRPVWWGKETE